MTPGPERFPPMKIICAPDKFKGSLSAREAAHAMARGIRQVDPDADVDLCPIADGGEGTVEALVAATGGQERLTRVCGPLGDPVEAGWGLLGRRDDAPLTAVVEMAAASGLGLVPQDRQDPTRTTTLGTGELIRAALDAGARRVIVGIGGSATNDGGCGMAQALGVRFLRPDGSVLGDQWVKASELEHVGRIDMSGLDPRIAQAQFVVASDVTNPLTGPDGASHVYGPQKGATAAQVRQLDRQLEHLAHLVRTQLHRDIRTLAGSGAAGGLGGGLVAFLGAELAPGAQLVLEAVRFDSRVLGRDLCLTGEGKLDAQSLSGKAVMAVVEAAKKAGVRTCALVGATTGDARRALDAGLGEIRVIGEDVSQSESMRNAAPLLEEATARLLRDIREQAP